MDAGIVLEGLLDLVFPKRCVVCRRPGAWLCDACAVDLRPVPERRCPRCGAPARPSTSRRREPTPLPADLRVAICPECRGRRIAFVTASAAFCYEGPARALVTACKFRALRSLADDMARRAAPAFAAAVRGPGDPEAAGRAGVARASTPAGFAPAVAVAAPAVVAPVSAGPAPEGPLVTSVPAHRDHRLERGFDPAELLARRLAAGAGLTYAPVLRRLRHGARQSGLDRDARAVNVHHAFALREDANGVRTKLKRVVIVDDVYTTGETLNQCAEALAAASLEPHVFTFARTVRAAPATASREQAVRRSDVHENADQGSQRHRHIRPAGIREREDRARTQAPAAAQDR